MSWDILQKANLQYFLQKLKGKLDLKVDSETGKGLSTNDYTTAEKNKLANLNGLTYMVKGVDYVTAGKMSDTEIGTNATAEGSYVTSTGNSAHAENSNTRATGNNSHAQGFGTEASGWSSHAQGTITYATGISSSAEGSYTYANGENSHAEGESTIASGNNQHVQGKFNVDDANSTYAHIVGNGSSSKRSNAHTLDWRGNAWFAGDVETASYSIVNGALNVTFEV